MSYAPIARIILRYVVGAVIGAAQAEAIVGDPDIVTIAALAVGALVEALYALAVKNGWAK